MSEHDERDAKERAVREGIAYGESVWIAAEAHFESRLVSVEQERDNLRTAFQHALEELTESHERRVVAERAEAELEKARRVLAECRDTAQELAREGSGRAQAIVLACRAALALEGERKQ